MNIQPDKVKHFWAGAGLAVVTYALFALVLAALGVAYVTWVPVLAALCASWTAGVTKEVWDLLGNGTPEAMDLVWTFGGGLAGIAFMVPFHFMVYLCTLPVF